MKDERLRSVSFCMNEEGIERLTSFVERTKIPKSIFIREAILQALDKYEKRQKGDEFP